MGIKKLDDRKVEKIRKLWKDKRYTQKELAKKFNVSVMTIQRYVNKKSSKYYNEYNKKRRSDKEYRRNEAIKNRVYVNRPEVKKRKKIYNEKWIKNNREDHNKIMLSYYYKDKNKWNSRNNTGRLLKTKKYQDLIPKKVCKRCGSNKNIQLHHEKYPKKVEEILKCFKNGDIYFVCRRCHKIIDKDKKYKYK